MFRKEKEQEREKERKEEREGREEGNQVSQMVCLCSGFYSCFGKTSLGDDQKQFLSHFWPIQRGLSTYLFSRVLHPQFSNPVPPWSLMIQPNLWLQPIHQYMITCLAISPSNQNEQPGTLPEVLPPGRISLHCCLLGMSQKGLWCYSCLLSSSVYLLCRIIYETALRLFFLLQLPLQ